MSKHSIRNVLLTTALGAAIGFGGIANAAGQAAGMDRTPGAQGQLDALRHASRLAGAAEVGVTNSGSSTGSSNQGSDRNESTGTGSYGNDSSRSGNSGSSSGSSYGTGSSAAGSDTKGKTDRGGPMGSSGAKGPSGPKGGADGGMKK